MECQVFKNDLGQVRVIGDKNNRSYKPIKSYK